MRPKKGIASLTFLRRARSLAWMIFLSSSSFGALRYTPSDLELIIGARFVQAMAFDARGQAWVSTQQGLHIIDDSAVDAVGSVDALPNVTNLRNIISIGSIDKESMYAVTKDGRIVSIFPQERLYSSQTIADIKGRISADPVLYDRHLYFISNGALNRRPIQKDPENPNGRPIFRGAASTLPLATIATLTNVGVCAGSGEAVYCGLATEHSYDPLLIYRGDSGDKIRFLLPYSNKEELLIVLDAGKLVFASATRTSPPEEYYFQELKTNQPRVLTTWQRFILFGTDEGVFSLDTRTKEMVRIDAGRLKRVTGFVSQAYGVWVLTESGVVLLSDSQLGFWPQDFKSFPREVLSISRFRDAIYAGTYSGVFDIGDHSHQSTAVWPTPSDSGLDRRITALAPFQGMLAAGTFSGQLHFLEGRNGRLVRSKTALFDSGISSIASIENTLVVGTGRNGIFAFRNETALPVAMPLAWERHPSPITAIEPTNSDGSDGGVIFLTEHGVGVLCARDIQAVCGYTSLPVNAEEAIAVSASALDDGSVLVGTLYGGLFETSVRSIVKREPMKPVFSSLAAERHIYTLDSMNSRDLWVGTDNGVSVVNLETGIAQHFSRIHGMINQDINHGASLLSNDGTYFVGGRSGVDRISRSAKHLRSSHPRVRLLSVSTGDSHFDRSTTMNELSRVVLPSDDSSIEIRVTIADFRDLSETTYSFFLEGWDDRDTTSSGLGIAKYKNLPPGNYTFKARGADAFGVWSNNEITVPITVLPPTWRTWWALLAYALAACLLFLIARRSYRNHLLRSLRIQRAEEEARALARLEDEWQEQREANERLLQSITPSTQGLLHAVEVALKAELDEPAGETGRLEKSLQIVEVLERQQDLVSRSNAGAVCSLRALVEEIGASIAAAQSAGNTVIIVNNTPDVSITTRHAQYLTLVIFETLSAVVARCRIVALEEPIIHAEVLPPGYGDEPVEAFVILLEDRDFPVERTEGLEDALSITTQLLQIFTGALEIDRDLGVRLRIELALDDASLT